MPILGTGLFSLSKLSRLVKLTATLLAVSPEVPVSSQKHMIALVAGTCFPGSTGAPSAALTSLGVSSAQASFTTVDVAAGLGGSERQPLRSKISPANETKIHLSIIVPASRKGTHHQ